jgi:hypothetical protein
VYEVTEQMLHLEGQSRDLHALGMERVPLRVLINPRVTPLGTHTVVHREGCLSVPGFSAHVARALAVQVDAHDLALNTPVSFRATGWTARILQHEVCVWVGACVKCIDVGLFPFPFSHLSFSLIHVSPLIHAGADGPPSRETLYRRHDDADLYPGR